MKKMEIYYVKNDNGKLFSFTRYDYKDDTDDYGNYIMIDGGFDYTKFSGEIKKAPIKDLIREIRGQFTWRSIRDRNGNYLEYPIERLLQNMETSHIEAILREQNLTEVVEFIFKTELEFRKQ